jgi:Ca-activated chloride channel family protein
MLRTAGLILLSILSIVSLAHSDGFILPMPPEPGRPFPPNLSIKYHHVDISIDDQVARTEVDQVFKNNFHRDLEGTYIFPIPEDASISKFSMFIGGEEVKGKILDREEARRIYRDIVRRKKDPALLEYFKDGMFKASVYPIPANGETRIKLDYSEVLQLSGGLCGYRYTLNTEKFSRDPLQSVKLSVTIRSKKPIKSIYSPSHTVKIDKESDHLARVTYIEENTRPDKDFLLYYTVSEEDVGFDLLAYEEDQDDGFFLAMISPRVEVPVEGTSSKDICFVFDTSGSMSGEKIEQARGALSFCLNSLNEGDRFNVIDFDDEIRNFKSDLVPASRENVREALAFVDGCAAEGGTNINDALRTGLGQIDGRTGASFIIFLTDGLPTVGETKIENIWKNVIEANRVKTRLFVFGVGYDVNTRLLDRLALDNHGTSDYVRPTEDIEVKVSSFYKKVSHPVLTDVTLTFDGITVRDLYPREIPDIFKGSQIIVVGRFGNGGKAEVTLSGSTEKSSREFIYTIDISPEGCNDFIPRLWATRKIGYLVDQIRLHGQNKELVDEIVRLSKKYGIITEYTSFIVDADYRLATDDLAPQAYRVLERKLAPEVGAGAVDQSLRMKSQQYALSAPEGIIDAEGKVKKIETMAQVGPRTFFNKEGIWVDSEYEGEIEAVQIRIYSDAYFELLNAAPEVGRYLALGEHVIFLLNDRAFHISEEGKSAFEVDELRTLLRM